MRRPLHHDCAACADLRVRLGEFEQRLAALEQSRPRLRLVAEDTPPRETVPAWPPLPRARVDSAHPPRVPHPLLMAVFVSARGGAAYRRGAEEGTARPLLLNRVA